ncbi:protein expanded isoform X3 [Monomorium pharaonis]|uniref:protein expanded isoform X3 n=1 Tax=Monomorium pharaonis TaxID=307658 RepID=UPI00174739B2|nr:protein expanded isoform X3 [Monomorium pharaonis]
MENNPEIAKLKQKKRIAKASFTRAENFLRTVEPDRVKVDEVNLRLKKLEEAWKAIEESLTELAIFEAFSEEQVDQELVEQEERYIELRLFGERLVRDRVRPAFAENNLNQAVDVLENQRIRNNDNQVKLPKIELPVFSGKYEDWHSFYNTFQSLIHSNQSINEIQKFHYLISSVKGEAAETIASLEISEANYRDAWFRLKERYDIERFAVQNHIKAIFELPTLKKENSITLRSILDGILKHIRALAALKRPTSQWDDLLIYVITSKLDYITTKEWESHVDAQRLPTFQELIEFLTKRCQMLEAVARRNPSMPKVDNSRSASQDGEYLFVDPENKLSKYAPKNWRNSHTHGLDSSGSPIFVLYFRVRFYVDTPLLLSDETSRHHYYLQLRDNVVRHGGGVESLHPHHPLHEPSIVTPLLVLAGLALQADLGDYSEERHRPHAGSIGYCKSTDYLPPHMCLESNVLAVLATQHREYSGLSREEAELQYIREAVLLEAPLNAHLYRLRRSKNEAGPGRILLAICARGVRIYAEEETPRVFAWNNIGKLSFDRKKFEIRAVDQPEKLTLYSGCDDKSKLLLGLCRDTHQFSMAIAPRVNEAMKREEEERKVLRDCYMYPTRCKLSLTARGARGDQRISVISSTSSNTTSGIVSDRVHSEDEPDTAPASTECLPRLTETVPYSDGQSKVLNGTNGDTDNHSMPPSSVSIIDEIDSSDATSTSVVLRLASSAATAAEGSQCSSSCSTVVVVNTSAGGTSRMRRTSATSSLELGYSHTAQNSAISSETASFPGVIYDRCKKTGTDIASETSGVYTLRSSEIQDERIGGDMYSPTGDTNESSAASDVCALSSVQSTTDEASITSGFYTIHSGLRSESSDVYTEDVGVEDQEPIYSLCKGDDDDRDSLSNRQLEDSRSRSNSILSVSSFRGDGSDPSSARPLLSADELSDLIVGRYPPRKTIGNSMDSDCDYVTMPPPPPPPPPPRTDSDRQLPPPPPYPIQNIDYATINASKRSNIPEPQSRERQPPPPPPPYNSSCSDFVPLPPRRTDPPPPPPPYTSSRERIQIPPPTPPRNDAVTPREPPPPPPPYPTDISTAIGTIPRATKTTNDVAGNVAPKPPPRIQPPTYPGDKMKPTPVHAPVAALVVGPNNYLDVHASRAGPVLLPYLTTPPPPPPLPPPPIVHPRQPPPPPPPPPPSSSSQQPASSLATVYTSQVSRSQIEQYQQQLYSDVDYVMFPLKDPAVSKQEYIDAKQGSLLAAMAAYPPPPYPSFNNKSSVIYRSTPYLPGSSFSSQSKYASNQNLSSSDTGSSSGNYLQGNLNSHYAASTSSLYSGATCSSTGSHSLRREPPVPAHPLDAFSRTRSDENILKCLDTLIASKMQSLPQSKHRRLPPPPPPPPYEIQNLEKNQPLPSSSSAAVSLLTATTNKFKKLSNGVEENDEGKGDDMLDIRTLREKSRNLDLPLISALCNDQYLLKQTKAFVLPKHPSEITSTTASTKSGTRSSNGATSSRNKYPVSGLSTTQIQKPLRKSSTSTHKHPSETKSSAHKVNTSSAGVSTTKKDFTRASHS